MKKKETEEVNIHSCYCVCISLCVITWDPLAIIVCGFLLDNNGFQDTLPSKYGALGILNILFVFYFYIFSGFFKLYYVSHPTVHH